MCSTCCHHKILLTVGHPISNVIKGVLLEKLNNGLEYTSTSTDTQVENIVNFLEFCGLNKSYQQSLTKINDIQQKAAYSKPLLGLQGLLALASITCSNVKFDDSPGSCAKALSKCIYQEFTALPSDESIKFESQRSLLNPIAILRTLTMIESNIYKNDSEKNLILTKALFQTKKLLHSTHISVENLLSIVLHFLYLEVYDDDLLDTVYGDSRILVPAKHKQCNKGNEANENAPKEIIYKLKPRYVYAELDPAAMLIRRAFLILNGIVEMNYPQYLKARRKLDAKQMDYLLSWFGM